MANSAISGGSLNGIGVVDVSDLAAGTDGELITWDSAGAATTVAVGTTDHVLTSNGAGAAPTFQAASGGGGGWTFVSTTTAAGGASLAWISLQATSTYKMIISRYIPVSDSDLYLTVSTDNGDNYATADYQYNFMSVDAGAFNSAGSSTAAQFILSDASIGGAGTGSDEFGYNATIIFYNVNTANYPLSYTLEGAYQDTVGDGNLILGGGVSADDAAGGSTDEIDAIKLAASTGNMETGTFTLYKWVNS